MSACDDLFEIKENDTSPGFRLQLNLSDEQTLEGASVRFHMARADGTLKVNSVGRVVSIADEQIEYLWSENDTTEAGNFKSEFEVTFSDGSVETFPNNRYLRVRIYRELD